jgi:hypothetical protein
MSDPTPFKSKGAKLPESRTTLDALHVQKMTEMANEKQNIENYKKDIVLLREKMKQSTSDMEIWSLEQQLERLQKKVTAIENDGEKMNYFLRTGNILFEYYDVQQKIQQGTAMVTTQSKAKPGSILAILNDLQKD